jgi:ATP-dependent Lhr-like helicase
MSAPNSGLEVFHPLIREWFSSTLGEPTQVQDEAWPKIAAGHHLLVSAPTGTGKTLTAFLWALHQLLTGAWPGGRVRVLYVSPLKALNNDIQRNLLSPLAHLEAAFDAAGAPHEAVRVATRSGDTPSAERQRMVRRPPEILITTPESLNILLTSQGGRSMLGGIQSVIFDEIHAVAGSKRGTHWVTAVDRLVPLAGEFQRIALSATARPLETIARFIGGYEMRPLDERGAEVEYRERPVAIVTSTRTKEYDLSIDVAGPELVDTSDPMANEPDKNSWESLADALLGRIETNRSTLIFANSRRSTERMTRLLNDGAGHNLVYSHHGSLSRELRNVVERRLKDGELKAIVATNSLELGIDIGALDEVALVQTPPTVAAAIQRLGRAGHGVGEISRGSLYPLFERDLISAAVVGRCVLAGDIEAIEPVVGALDVLAQIVLSMTAAEPWDVDALYSFLRGSYPYRDLSRRQFDLVLEMLAGRYADSRIRELAPRLTIDRVANQVRARPGTAWTVYMSGGTIPDRGYYNLRLADSMAKVGELDEEFVWERRLGDTFTLGAQNWRVQRITHSDVLVSPAHRTAAMTPFWRADARDRSFFLSERIGRFLERAERLLATAAPAPLRTAAPEGADAPEESRGSGRDQLIEELQNESRMTATAAARLADLLERQREATGVALPHRRHLVVEHCADPTGRSQGRHAILHTGWGGRVNRPFAMALAAAWETHSEAPLQVEAENDCILIATDSEVELDQLLQWVRGDNLETLLRDRLQQTGLFGGRFRENAGRALLLPRSDAKRRVPLWLTRERAKKLLEAVSRYDDFPIVVETWRTCLQDAFDLPALKRMLDEIAQGRITITETRTSTPSPFATGLVWQQTNRLMYEDDAPTAEGGLSRTLLQELVFSSQLRPQLPAALLDTFQRKLQRTFPGYAPRDAPEVLAWIDERLAMPPEELDALLATRRRQLPEDDGMQLLADLEDRACVVETESGARWVCAVERLPRVLRGVGLDLTDVRLSRLSAPAEPAGHTLAAAAQQLVRRRADEEQRSPIEDDVDAPADAEPGLDTGADELAGLLAEWLRFYGPVAPEVVGTAFGLQPEAVETALARLVDEERVVVDRFRRGSELEEVCDAENLERLLRLLRAASRPAFEAQPLDRLPLLLAVEQGLAERGDGVEGLHAALERLLLYPAGAASWESDLLPARLDPYYPAWLDSVLQESALGWLGTGRERLTFAFPEERELLAGTESSPPLAATLAALAHGRARSFEELLRGGKSSSAELTAELWQAVWAGAVANSRFSVVRRGVARQFKAEPLEPPRRHVRPGTRRRAFDRWRSARPFGGDWFELPPLAAPSDALEAEELGKERARLLLARYGILFRELLDRELPGFRWSSTFRSLRIMELSGEVVAGHFFEGILGPQFMSLGAWRRLSEGLVQDGIYWLSAVDPAAPCGLALEAWRGRWPARRASNHLVFDGARRVVTSQRHGCELEIQVEPGHPHLPEYFQFLKVMLTRQFEPRKAVDVETINGEPATTSPYAETLREIFSTTREPKSLRLRRRY